MSIVFLKEQLSPVIDWKKSHISILLNSSFVLYRNKRVLINIKVCRKMYILGQLIYLKISSYYKFAKKTAQRGQQSQKTFHVISSLSRPTPSRRSVWYHEGTHWPPPAASNIFFLPSMPDMASTFLRQSPTSLVKTYLT